MHTEDCFNQKFRRKGKYVLVDEGLTGEKAGTKSTSCIVGSQKIISKLESQEIIVIISIIIVTYGETLMPE